MIRKKPSGANVKVGCCTTDMQDTICATCSLLLTIYVWLHEGGVAAFCTKVLIAIQTRYLLYAGTTYRQ